MARSSWTRSHALQSNSGGGTVDEDSADEN